VYIDRNIVGWLVGWLVGWTDMFMDRQLVG